MNEVYKPTYNWGGTTLQFLLLQPKTYTSNMIVRISGIKMILKNAHQHQKKIDAVIERMGDRSW